MSVLVGFEVPGDVLVEVPDEVPDDVPVELLVEVPDDVPVELLVELPDEAPVESESVALVVPDESVAGVTVSVRVTVCVTVGVCVTVAVVVLVAVTVVVDAAGGVVPGTFGPGTPEPDATSPPFAASMTEQPCDTGSGATVVVGVADPALLADEGANAAAAVVAPEGDPDCDRGPDPALGPAPVPVPPGVLRLPPECVPSPVPPPDASPDAGAAEQVPAVTPLPIR